MKDKLKIAIASGKGGVGKSMIASSLAMLFAKPKQIIVLDCDVDAPNLHLWLGQKENWDKVKKISTNEIPVIDKSKCNLCGKCVDICAFDALSFNSGVKNNKTPELKVNHFFCEGCGACEVVCPQKAVSMKKIYNAEIKTKNKVHGFPLISAQLYPGQTGSGKIVDVIKEMAENLSWQIMILDSPAGIGCPVIAALNGIDFCLLVCEPTPSGFSDLKRVLQVVLHFKLDFGVVINKWDINPKLTAKIVKKYKDKIFGKISYDQQVFKAISSLRPIVKTKLKARGEIIKIYRKLTNHLCLKK